MLEHLVQNWHVRKPVAQTRGGIVATQNRIAGEAGAKILARAATRSTPPSRPASRSRPSSRGTAASAASASCSSISRKRTASKSSTSARSRRAASNPADYPLTGGFTSDLFTWPTVKDDRNVHGPDVDRGAGSRRRACARAREIRHDELRRRDAARDRARRPGHRGRLVSHAQGRDDGARARALSDRRSDVWLPGGYPPVTAAGAPLGRLVLKGLAGTMRRLAEAGPRDFYEGDVAAEHRARHQGDGRLSRARRPAQLPRAHRQAARNRISRRADRARAGSHRGPDDAARARERSPK